MGACCRVRCEQFAVVVTTTLECPNFVVAHVFHKLFGAWVATKEVLTNEGTVVGFVGLVVTVRGGVHQVDKGAVLISVEEGVPFTAPHDLDNVPACTLELCFQFLDDFAVSTHWAVKALKVAVDNEGEVVELLLCCELDHAA